MPKQKSKVDPKMQARLDAKVRPDEPVKEDRIYINMKPKKKAPAKKTTKRNQVKSKEYYYARQKKFKVRQYDEKV